MELSVAEPLRPGIKETCALVAGRASASAAGGVVRCKAGVIFGDAEANADAAGRDHVAIVASCALVAGQASADVVTVSLLSGVVSGYKNSRQREIIEHNNMMMFL